MNLPKRKSYVCTQQLGKISWLGIMAAVALCGVCHLAAQNTPSSFDNQNRLRGSITAERAWWNLQHYSLNIEVFPEEKRIEGSNTITFEVLKPHRTMQIDLQEPLEISRITFEGTELEFRRDGNAHFVMFEQPLEVGSVQQVEIFYGGVPIESKNPPWSGGVTWAKDQHDKHFIATTCQGIGASVWWPNKDHGYDEPDQGVDITVTVPEDLVVVANGRLISSAHNQSKATTTFVWKVTNPINNYCVNVNIGDYVNFVETYAGEGGPLEMSYWVLRNDREAAERQFKEAPRSIEAFEHWFGKYPFYEDSFKLVQVPYLGMEHQSSVTYGNGFQNGYRGRDLSETGVGMLFDFIIVHETGHEWFGNNISMSDSADMWIHEGFTNYSENLFVEYHFGRKPAEDYVIGCRRLVQNDRPIIPEYNTNQRGSGDMYYKGGNMLHSMRHVINDDEKWRNILRGLNQEFWHQTVSTEQIESFISEHAEIDFSKFFDQYLRSTKIPVFVYQIDGNQVTYHYDNVVEGFSYPIEVSVNGNPTRLTPGTTQSIHTSDSLIESFVVNRNFYVDVKSTPSFSDE